MTRTRQLAVVSAALLVVLAIGTAAVAFVFHRGPFARADGGTTVVDVDEPLDLGPVIATVDGNPVYLGEAKSRVEGIASLHGDIETVLGEEWRDAILQSLVSDQVLRAAATELGVTITEADIQASVAEVEGMVGEGQTLETWLEAQGMSYAELERRIELQLIGSRVYVEVTRDVTVAGEEIRAYYREHKLEFTGADGHVSSLLEVKRSIRDGLLKDAKDLAYATWLADAKAEAEVVVVMDDWWKEVL